LAAELPNLEAVEETISNQEVVYALWYKTKLFDNREMLDSFPP
jgi:hypothetical protein